LGPAVLHWVVQRSAQTGAAITLKSFADSHRAQSPGVGQPTHQPRSGPSWKRRRGTAAPAPGRHAELLLPRRLSWRTSAGIAKRWRCRWIMPLFRHRIIRNENESPSCISPSPGFGPRSFAEPCDWPRAGNVRFSGPYGAGVLSIEVRAPSTVNRRCCADQWSK
jgi:hypothetical protein